MNCKSLQELISRYLDGALTKDEERLLLCHLASCSACSEVLGLFRRNREVLRSLPRTFPSPTVRNKVFAAWAREATLSSRPSLRHGGEGKASAGQSPGPNVPANAGVRTRRGASPGRTLPLFRRSLQSRRPHRFLRRIRLAFASSVPTIAYGSVLATVICLAGIGVWYVWRASGTGNPEQISALTTAPVAEEVTPRDDLATPLDALAAHVVLALTFPASPPLQAEEDMAVPAYLPSGIRLERLTLGNDRRSGRIMQVEMVFRDDPGTILRLNESRVYSVRLDPGSLAESSGVVIAGRDWQYGRRPGTDPRVANVLLGRRGRVMICLEGGLPLPELVKVVESFPSD